MTDQDSKLDKTHAGSMTTALNFKHGPENAMQPFKNESQGVPDIREKKLLWVYMCMCACVFVCSNMCRPEDNLRYIPQPSSFFFF